MSSATLAVVGMGPGSRQGMTSEAVGVLMECECIYAYTVYADLLRPFFPDKKIYSTGMRMEKERCLQALQSAVGGMRTAVVCSGDGGIYGMASLLYEMAAAREEFSQIEIVVVAGVTAATSGAAVLGAPLGHDFAVISLSDLLTPLDDIRKRIRLAAEGDFVLCLYNPSSKKRKDYLKMACEEVLRYRSKDTVCGYVTNIGREGQKARLLSLGELKETQTDMFTTVYIGNSASKNINGKMVTPRGYQWEADYESDSIRGDK